MELPSSSRFSVDKVAELVGRNREIHVQKCSNQRTVKMTMAKFIKFYKKQKNTKEKYNVLSLEFSDTDLNQRVQRPKVINQLDWITIAFPTFLRLFLNALHPSLTLILHMGGCSDA